jgi:hypothetical protein
MTILWGVDEKHPQQVIAYGTQSWAEPAPFVQRFRSLFSRALSALQSVGIFCVSRCGAEPGRSSYSVRNACIGSIDAARRAGISAATKPQTASNTQTDKIVAGS